MLNITHISVSKYLDPSNYKSFKHFEDRSHSKYLPKIMIGIFLLFIASMFLPWTQNIRSTGQVSTLNPYDKPQNIQSLLGGKIDKWYVKEGQLVDVGDTIAILTEAKEEYLDPDLLANTKVQREAKLRSVDAYNSKYNFLVDQLDALQELQKTKIQQLQIKQQQIEIEINSMQQELIAAETYAENASNQLLRMEQMHERGIKSLTDLETKKLSNREAEAKLLSVKNKLTKLDNDKLDLIQEREFVLTDFQQKVAKVESEIQSTNSYRFSLEGESNKLQSKYNQIEQRQNAYIITSPINGRITKILKNGIGEFVKPQDDIATIVPTEYQRAVELYVQPVDMPLIREGKEVRLQFDGWPAIVFSGWPNNSFGTYSGEVFAIDNDISENGKYRIIVVENDEEKKWPELIRIGSGARGLLLLNDVKVYYEVWRKLNGFPPDFYESGSNKRLKNKAPIRKVK